MSKRKVWNLYKDNTISSLKSVFNVHNTEDIEEFWLFFQENSIIKNEEVIHLIVQYLFKYTSEFLTKVESFDVILEYTENIQYITFWHQDYTEMLQQTYVDLKNYDYFNLKVDEDKSTFQIVRTKEICPDMRLAKETQENISIIKHKELVVYDFVNKDDLTSMQEINDELLNQMFYISSSQVDEDKISTIVNELDSYLSIFNKYNELQEISIIVFAFRDVLEGNVREIIENSNSDLNILFEGIITNLKNWTDMSFVKGIEDINYYNASLNSDVSMITQFLNTDDASSFQDDDDIFF